MFCTPTCAACKAAGSCPMGREPAAVVPPRKRKPDPARYAPNRVRPLRLSCGITIPYPIVKQLFGSKVWCEVHDAWEEPVPDPKTKPENKTRNQASLLDEIPPF